MMTTETSSGQRGKTTGRSAFPIALMVAGTVWIIVPIAAILAFSWQFSGDTWYSVVGSCLILGGAAAAVGAFAGFLFGVPKSLQSNAPVDDEVQIAGATEAAKFAISNNSNLEQISDWLTKILVGVGLVQLNQVPAALGKLGDVLHPVLGGTTGSGAFGIGLLVYCFLISFLLGYMWTRTRFFQVLTEYAGVRSRGHQHPTEGNKRTHGEG